MWLIDHGAALYFHHAWTGMDERHKDRFPLIKEHVLLQFASALEAADAAMMSLITAAEIRRIVDLVPDDWLLGDSAFNSTLETRQAYVDYLVRRLDEPRYFAEEAIRARSILV